MQTRSFFHRGHCPAAVSLLSSLPLLAALLALGAAPAHATGGDITGSVSGTISVNSSETLTIYSPGSVTAAGPNTAITVEGGTANIYGGSVSYVLNGVINDVGRAILVRSGTVNVYGGSVSSDGGAIYVLGGTANIYGGTISATGLSGWKGITSSGGSVNIFGCNLQIDGTGRLTGTLQDGTPINTTTAGPINLISTCVSSYSVCNVLYDQTKAHKSGSTVPIKFQVCDGGGVNVSSATLPVTAIRLTWEDATASSQVEDSGTANPDSNFRYDAGLAGYVFNLSTRGLASGTWYLWFTVGEDSTLHYVQFDVK